MDFMIYLTYNTSVKPACFCIELMHLTIIVLVLNRFYTVVFHLTVFLS